jgi:5-methylthioadenosine/S-adenosylhomocysteine deaminase
MNAAALAYKGAYKKARCFDAAQAIKAATEGGAKAIGMEEKLGIIKEGALADIIIIDLFEPQFFPTNDIPSSLVYSAKGSEVDTVFINGRMVMEEKHVLSMNIGRIYSECERIADRLKMIKRY